MNEHIPTATPTWLEEAVFYQIYPQSFYDSNGDGIGDLRGIEQKLDYLASLGVSALWINPCFESPFQDAGYDVSDHYKVAPRYGTNDDLRRLIATAHERGIRVLLDLVPGHTSVEHPWFKASCKHERNEYSDWYIWTDSVWTWDVPGLRLVSGYAERDGCYVTNFFYFQPALNYGFANPVRAHPWQQPVDAPGPQRVRQELRNIMRFWLDAGADGFRVDMAGSLVKNDAGGHETARLWHEIRTWLDRDYPEAALVSEWSNPPVAIGAGGFHIDFLLPFSSPGYVWLFRGTAGLAPVEGGERGPVFFDRAGNGDICLFVDEYTGHYTQIKGRGQIAIPTGNHDINPRLGNGRDAQDLELIFLFLLTMPGVPFIYYGDEIGMRSLSGLPSKEGGYGRTGSRTPMQWDDSPNAGFSSAPSERLYLPVDAGPDRPTVATQEADPHSLLNRVRRLIALRKAHPALCASGDWTPVYAERGQYPFVYRRVRGDEAILVALNPAARAVEVALPDGLLTAPPETLYGADGAITRQGDRWVLRLPGVSGGAYRMQA